MFKRLKLPIGQKNPFRIVYKNYLKLSKSPKSCLPSSTRIEVLIPVVLKDLSALPMVIKQAKENLTNPIDNIYVVGRKGPIEQCCEQLNCVFVDEEAALPIKKSDIAYKGKEWHRSGWLFQQLIKLNADFLTRNEHILVLDADTFIINKQSFVLDDGTMVLNFSDEYHFPYSSYQKFLKLKKRFFLSFVCHHMLFKKSVLQNLKKEIEAQTGKSWIEGILSKIDLEEPCCFSEYELYGNYLYYNYPGSYQLEYWYNREFKRDVLNASPSLRLNGSYKTVSIHKYS